MPIGRTKPPSNSYSMAELITIFTKYDNISFFAISNVNSELDIVEIQKILPKNIILVPKIESPEGVLNIQQIVSVLQSEKKIVMLDHDDLYSSLTKQNKSPSEFKIYFNKLVDFCIKNQVTLLRTIGVVFSDEEKKVSQYIK
jgi:citrate lyase beta subunit